MALAPGTRIGVYQIEHRLGAGGMGEVYRARDTTLGRDVAIKILPNDFADDPERVARFQREAQVLAALNHQHIAQLYGWTAVPDQSRHRHGAARTDAGEDRHELDLPPARGR